MDFLTNQQVENGLGILSSDIVLLFHYIKEKVMLMHVVRFVFWELPRA